MSQTVYFGTSTPVDVLLESDRTGTLAAESLAGATRMTLSLTPQGGGAVVVLDSAVDSALFDWTAGGTGVLYLYLGGGRAYGLSEGVWIGTLTVYGTVAGRTYSTGLVWGNTLDFSFHTAPADSSDPARDLNEIERLVLDLIGEDAENPDVFTDGAIAPIRDSVNAAIQELAMLTGSYVRTVHLVTVPGRAVYRITETGDHWGYALEVYDRSRHRRLTQTSIIKLGHVDPEWLQQNGDPDEYCHIGANMLGLYRVPTTALALEIRAVLIPRFYTSGSDPIELRHQWRQAAASYAVSEFYAGRGDAGRAAEAFKDYLTFSKAKLAWPNPADREVVVGRVR